MKTIYARGWVSLLFRKQDAEPPASPEHLHEDDYECHGSRIALAEFESPFEVYEFFSNVDHPLHPGMIRYLDAYDILHVETTAPRVCSSSFILLPAAARCSFLFTGCRVQTLPARPLQLVPLQQPISL